MRHTTPGGICLLAAAAAAAWADSAAAGFLAAPEGVNLWTTESGLVNYGLFPIPADFFGPGSDPFTGSAVLVGVPLDPGPLGSTDTIIRRGDVVFPGAGFPRPSDPVPIEIIALSLTSIVPITVTENGGQNPELWFLDVDLSVIPVPTGNLDAVLEHANGGTNSAILEVLPRFTFTKVSDAGQVRVFDTGIEGFNPFLLGSVSPYSLVVPGETPLDVGPNVACPTCPGTSNFWFGVDHTLGTLDLFQFQGNGLTLSFRTTAFIPTPGTLALLGLAGLCGTRRRRR